MKETNEKSGLPVFSGEIALIIAVIINSCGVALMLHSGAGISAISSVPFAFSELFPQLTLGTWTYIFQGVLVFSLMVLRKKFSFVVGFAFGEMLDVHQLWITTLPQTIPLRVIYFIISYLIICIGIAISNRCGLPIIPTDLFPRELEDITKVKYSKIKIAYDVICLTITAILTGFGLGHIDGLGIGTVLAAFTMGKVVGLIGELMDKHINIEPLLVKKIMKKKTA